MQWKKGIKQLHSVSPPNLYENIRVWYYSFLVYMICSTNDAYITWTLNSTRRHCKENPHFISTLNVSWRTYVTLYVYYISRINYDFPAGIMEWVDSLSRSLSLYCYNRYIFTCIFAKRITIFTYTKSVRGCTRLVLHNKMEVFTIAQVRVHGNAEILNINSLKFTMPRSIIVQITALWLSISI